MSILDYCTKDPYPEQRKVLEAVESQWNYSDVIVIEAPTASGKTMLAHTIARWNESKGKTTAITTPTNQLVDQMASETKLPSLKGASQYECKEYETTCDNPQKKCPKCPFKQSYVATRIAGEKESRGPNKVGVFNYMSYYSSKNFAHTLIIDEGHQILNVISNMSSVKLWRHDFKFSPKDVESHGNLAAYILKISKLYYQQSKMMRRDDFWTRDEPNPVPRLRADQTADDMERESERLESFASDIQNNHRDFYYAIHQEHYRGKSAQCLVVKPLTLRNLPPRFWPKQVKKVVVMSATINKTDIYELGLYRKKVSYIKMPSPIPAANRPIVKAHVASMKYQNRKEALPKIVAAIKDIADSHPNEKGLIHCTYDIAKQIGPLLGNRILTHNKDNKLEVYNQFLESSEPHILVGSGMAEGVDLVGDTGRWQVVVAIPYPHWGDGYVRTKSDIDPEWYNQVTVQTMQQQFGRICRTPTDRGVTYVLDNRFSMFHRRTHELWPDYINDAMMSRGTYYG